MDGSGSMLGKWENTLRITAAKVLLGDLVDSLKVNPNLELALRVYGHQYHRNYQNCKDTKLEIPFSANNHEKIQQKLLQIKPQGTTPIAYSLQQAAQDFPAVDGYRNIIIIITDGVESCDGDPCAVSLALQQKGIFLKPFVIGIGMNETFEEQFKCVGQFFDADNINGFKSALNTAIKQSLDKATVSIELLDIQNKPTETNVNITFFNNFTQEAAYEFVHYRDQQGRPDSVEVDPVLSYNIKVNTIPPVYKSNVEIEGGKHNVIPIKTPQGSVTVAQKGYTEYADGVRILIREKDQAEIIHTMDIPENAKLLVGKYDLEILTLPKINFEDIQVEQSSLKKLEIPAPGVVNITASFPGFGSIYQMTEKGPRWVINLNENSSRSTFAIQPGIYKFVFRSKNSFGSKYTQVKDFTVTSGSTVNIKLNY